MPYANKEDLLAWRERIATKQKEKRKARQAEFGHRTPASLAWPRPLLTEAQAMWIAAVIDCEGCITVGSYLNKQRGGYNFRAVSQVSMTRQEVLIRLHELCAGTLHKIPWTDKRSRNRKDAWTWNISANGLRWLLPQIEPYLLIKRQQALLTLEFLTICKRGVSNRSSYNPRAQQIRAEMAALNFRGIPMGIGKSTEPLAELTTPGQLGTMPAGTPPEDPAC